MRRRSAGVVLVLTALVLALLVLQVDAWALSRTLRAADPRVVVACAAASLFLAIVVSAEGLRWTLRGLSHEVTVSTALQATVGNLALNGVLPAGAGQLSRGAWLHRVAGVPSGLSFLSAVATLWFKLVALLCASLVALLLLPGAPDAARIAVGSGAAAVALGGAASLRLVGARTRPVPLLVGALYGALTVAAEWALFAALLVAVGGPWLPVQTVAWFPLATIAGKLPVTAMGFGTREATVLWLFDGATPEQLFAAALLFSTVAQLLPALVGTVGTWSFLAGLVAAPEPEA